MVASDAFAEFLREQLAPLGRLTMRRMFGKTGVFCDGVMLGMVTENTLYFRVDEENRVIFRANTGALGVPIAPFEGKRRIRFRLRGVPMTRGRYWITVAVHTRDERHIYHAQEQALSFEVLHEGYDPGEVYTPVDLEVEDL